MVEISISQDLGGRGKNCVPAMKLLLTGGGNKEGSRNGAAVVVIGADVAVAVIK